MIALPKWLEDNLPELREVEYVSFADGKFIFRGERYNTLSEAYDSAGRFANFDFDDSVMAAAGLNKADVFFTDGNRILPVSTDQDARWIIEEDFKRAVDSVRRWRADKESFPKSFAMLDSHPAFWQRDKPRPTSDWLNSNLVSGTFWFSVYNGRMVMECGAHVEPDYTSRYHDFRLDTEGESFEDCIIMTAALVDKFFHSNGEEREGVEYDPSPLELTLKERMDNLDTQG